MATRKVAYTMLVVLLLVPSLAWDQEVDRPTGGVVKFLEPILPDPVLQHSKEVYVLNGCAYCHGVDLKVRNGEAADLLHSPIVAADKNGSVIGPLLRQGIPQTAKLSPMPSYGDLSERSISDLARWIHYARQQGHYKELMNPTNGTGNAESGKIYFDSSCRKCHAEAELSKIVKKYDSASLKTHIIYPTLLNTVQSFNLAQLNDTKAREGRERHGELLERYTPKEVADLMAYIETLK